MLASIPNVVHSYIRHHDCQEKNCG